MVTPSKMRFASRLAQALRFRARPNGPCRAVAIVLVSATLAAPATSQLTATAASGPEARLARVRVTVRPGARILVYAPRDGPIVGTLVRGTADSIVLRTRDATMITLAKRDVQRFELSLGTRKHKLRNSAIGLAIGAGLGAVVGANSFTAPCKKPGEWFCGGGRQLGSELLPIPFGLLGGLIGLAIGAIGNEVWASRDVVSITRLEVSPRANGVRLAIAVRF